MVADSDFVLPDLDSGGSGVPELPELPELSQMPKPTNSHNSAPFQGFGTFGKRSRGITVESAGNDENARNAENIGTAENVTFDSDPSLGAEFQLPDPPSVEAVDEEALISDILEELKEMEGADGDDDGGWGFEGDDDEDGAIESAGDLGADFTLPNGSDYDLPDFEQAPEFEEMPDLPEDYDEQMMVEDEEPDESADFEQEDLPADSTDFDNTLNDANPDNDSEGSATGGSDGQTGSDGGSGSDGRKSGFSDRLSKIWNDIKADFGDSNSGSSDDDGGNSNTGGNAGSGGIAGSNGGVLEEELEPTGTGENQKALENPESGESGGKSRKSRRRNPLKPLLALLLKPYLFVAKITYSVLNWISGTILRRIPIVGRIIHSFLKDTGVLKIVSKIIPGLLIVYLVVQGVLGQAISSPTILLPDGGKASIARLKVDYADSTASATVRNEGDIIADVEIVGRVYKYAPGLSPSSWFHLEEVGNCHSDLITVEIGEEATATFPCQINENPGLFKYVTGEVVE